jgi:catechol 2,3-dioxygenase-like lactoylglutathione lyase family enzyme
VSDLVIDSLDHLVLTVRDLDATCRFYRDVLGMQVVTFGKGRVALRFGRQKINLHPVANDNRLVADRPTPGSADLCFLTDTPVDRWLAHLASAGVTVIEGPGERSGAEGPIMSIYFRDPDQNLVEVSNRLPHTHTPLTPAPAA